MPQKAPGQQSESLLHWLPEHSRHTLVVLIEVLAEVTIDDVALEVVGLLSEVLLDVGEDEVVAEADVVTEVDTMVVVLGAEVVELVDATVEVLLELLLVAEVEVLVVEEDATVLVVGAEERDEDDEEARTEVDVVVLTELLEEELGELVVELDVELEITDDNAELLDNVDVVADVPVELVGEALVDDEVLVCGELD